VNSNYVTGSPEARAQELIDAMTSAIFSHMSTILSADHRELLAFLLALERLHATHRLTDKEMSLWMGDLVTGKVELHLPSVDDVCPSWLSHEVAFVLIYHLFCCVFFGSLLHYFFYVPVHTTIYNACRFYQKTVAVWETLYSKWCQTYLMAVIPGQPFMSQYQTMLEKLIVHYHLSHCFHWNSLILSPFNLYWILFICLLWIVAFFLVKC